MGQKLVHEVRLYEFGEEVFHASLFDDGGRGTIVDIDASPLANGPAIAHTVLLSVAHLLPPELSVKILSVVATINAILDNDPSVKHPD